MQYLSLCDWLISLSTVSSRLIHAIAYVRISFGGCLVFAVCTHCVLLVLSSVDEYLGCSHILTIVNNAVRNMSVETFHWDSTLNSHGYISRNRIAELHSISIFNFWRTAIPFSLAVHFIVPSTGHEGPDSLHPHQTYFLFVFGSSYPWYLWDDIWCSFWFTFSW